MPEHCLLVLLLFCLDAEEGEMAVMSLRPPRLTLEFLCLDSLCQV